MSMMSKEVFLCNQCTGEVGSHSQFCIHCGSILLGHVLFCRKHLHTEAAGVCVICQQPFCFGCAQRIDGALLCSVHAVYEIYESMARVYGINDSIMANHIGECLSDSGLHPMVITSQSSPLQMNGLGTGLVNRAEKYGNSLFDEYKIMVPCEEVMLAEKRLRDLEFLPRNRRPRL